MLQWTLQTQAVDYLMESNVDRICCQYAILDAAVSLGSEPRILIDRVRRVCQRRTVRTQLNRIGIGEDPDLHAVIVVDVINATEREQDTPRSRQHFCGEGVGRSRRLKRAGAPDHPIKL